jgi:hypothetical protein
VKKIKEDVASVKTKEEKPHVKTKDGAEVGTKIATPARSVDPE